MLSNLDLWQSRLAAAQQYYKEDIEKAQMRDDLYHGTKQIMQIGNTKPKNAGNVRNIIYELIESEVDSAIPVPKVSANTNENEKNAASAEALLRSEMKRLPMAQHNDEDERLCPVQGTAVYLLEWENKPVSHTACGKLTITLLHLSQLMVQPGVKKMENADWIIVMHSKTRQELVTRYPKMPKGDLDELLQVYVGYYKNETGGIGRCIWTGDTVLESLEDYETPQLYKCPSCKQTSQNEICSVCNVKAEKVNCDTLRHDIKLQSGEVLLRGEAIPIYSPHKYPIVLRKNVSAYGELFGESDVDKIADQQEAIKKLGSKIDEKILKGGSYVTLPVGVTVETSDRELKILRVKSPADKAMIDVYNIQPDISKDRIVLEENYQWAKSTLGITDAFQGKHDQSAVSGVAKQFAASQSAGRLESKQIMKNAAYAELFRLMFSFLLAYGEDYCVIATHSPGENNQYKCFCKYDFLRRDLAGELYWDDDLCFDVDVGGTMANNRQAMWQEMRQSFMLGAFGDKNTLLAQKLYWQMLANLNYPMAGMIGDALENQALQAAQQLPLQEASLIGDKHSAEDGGDINALPIL